MHLAHTQDLRYQIIQPVMFGTQDRTQEGFEDCHHSFVILLQVSTLLLMKIWYQSTLATQFIKQTTEEVIVFCTIYPQFDIACEVQTSKLSQLPTTSNQDRTSLRYVLYIVDVIVVNHAF